MGHAMRRGLDEGRGGREGWREKTGEEERGEGNQRQTAIDIEDERIEVCGENKTEKDKHARTHARAHTRQH